MTRTPTVEIEGPDTGWVASAGYDDTGDLRVLDARDEWQAEISRLVERLLAEPAPGGRIPGEHIRGGGEDVLYDLAAIFRHRKPECRGERLVAHVSGGHRAVEPSGYGEE